MWNLLFHLPFETVFESRSRWRQSTAVTEVFEFSAAELNAFGPNAQHSSVFSAEVTITNTRTIKSY